MLKKEKNNDVEIVKENYNKTHSWNGNGWKVSILSLRLQNII